MNFRIFFLLISLALPSGAQDLTFAGYPTGAMAHRYAGIGDPAVDVDLSFSGNTDRFTPTTSTVKTMPRPVTNGLQLQVNFADNSQSVTLTITFSQGVSGLRFNVFQIDRNTSGSTVTSQDRVTITADDRGRPVTPVLAPSAFVTATGNTLTGTANDPGSAPSQVVFSDYVSRLVITYGAGPNSPANPGQQSITIGQLSWQAPLPVELLSFTGQARGEEVLLRWETVWERQSERFEVERSTDLEVFTRIGSVLAAGTSEQRRTYFFTDPEPVEGVNYYRLRQVDFDGRSEHSPLVAVVRRPSRTVVLNPSDGRTIRIRYDSEADEAFRLLTLTGQDVPGRLVVHSPTEADWLPEQPLAPGVYLLEIRRGVHRRVVRILVR